MPLLGFLGGSPVAVLWYLLYSGACQRADRGLGVRAGITHIQGYKSLNLSLFHLTTRAQHFGTWFEGVSQGWFPHIIRFVLGEPIREPTKTQPDDRPTTIDQRLISISRRTGVQFSTAVFRQYMHHVLGSRFNI